MATFLLFGQITIHTHFPLTAEGVVVGDARWVKGFVVLEEVNKDPVDLVGGVNGGLDLALAALDGVEEGVAKVGAVESQVIAQEVERVAEEGIALLGHLAVDDNVTTDVDGRMHPGLGPDLIGEENVVDVADTGEVAGNEVRAGTWDGQEMSSRSGGK